MESLCFLPSLLSLGSIVGRDLLIFSISRFEETQQKHKKMIDFLYYSFPKIVTGVGMIALASISLSHLDIRLKQPLFTIVAWTTTFHLAESFLKTGLSIKPPYSE